MNCKKIINYNSNITSQLILYTLIGSIICAIGLLSDSQTVVVGTMLISPLGLVIVKLALSLLTNKMNFYKDLIIMILLVIVIYIIGFIIGHINSIYNLYNIPNNEMENRIKTQNLVLTHILIAFLSGILLAHTTLKSDYITLTGVGIAISILPPIVSSGIYHNLYYNFGDNENIRKGNLNLLISGINLLFIFITCLITMNFIC